jgi:MFS family permease
VLTRYWAAVTTHLRSSWRRGGCAGATAALGFGYLIGTVALAFVLLFSGVYGHEEVAGDGSGWHQDVDAWQWDAILVLGLLGSLAGFIALALRAAAAVSVHGALTGLGVGLVLHASVVNRAQLVFGWLATFASGAALVYLRSRRA